MADLPGALLGSAFGRSLTLDLDGAGHGWFLDPTPSTDEEFVPGDEASLARPGSGAEGRLDLLSVVLHELGHWLGRGHDEHGVMAESLPPGVRQVPKAPPTPRPVRVAVKAPARDVVPFTQDDEALTGLAIEIASAKARKRRPASVR